MHAILMPPWNWFWSFKSLYSRCTDNVSQSFELTNSKKLFLTIYHLFFGLFCLGSLKIVGDTAIPFVMKSPVLHKLVMQSMSTGALSMRLWKMFRQLANLFPHDPSVDAYLPKPFDILLYCASILTSLGSVAVNAVCPSTEVRSQVQSSIVMDF